MSQSVREQMTLYENLAPPRIAMDFPKLRFMGSKHRLLPWIYEILSSLSFDTAVDAFSGSGCVGYLLKTMGKEVTTNDFLLFSHAITSATIENSTTTLSQDDLTSLLEYDPRHKHFIERTFSGIFYTVEDLRFLDRLSWNIQKLDCKYKRTLALSAAVRSCVKRQPRGVFTIGGDLSRYDDGRRDLRLSLKEHFTEQVRVYNHTVFNNGRNNLACCGDVFELRAHADLIYMDPPYVPRADDNCYIKRYHFLEGLISYWEGVELLPNSKVKKIKKRYTPFSYKRTAIAAFSDLFALFSEGTLVLSYSSNGYPDLDILVELMRAHRSNITVFEKNHRYHFGNHKNVSRAAVQEYLIVGI